MTFPYTLIDLTHTLDSGIPAWNGGCGFHHDMHIDYGDCQGAYPFRVMKVAMHAGIGTHMDSPSHCIQGGSFIDDIDVNDLVMPCLVIDVSDKSFERYTLSVQDVKGFEEKYGRVTKGSCVMIKTGWSQFWHKPEQYHNNHVFPSVSVEAAEYLLEQGVQAIGVDTLSPDRPEDGFGVHKTFLGAGKIILENVANLANMPVTGGFIMALPMKIKEGTEAPVRLVGLMNPFKNPA